MPRMDKTRPVTIWDLDGRMTINNRTQSQDKYRSQDMTSQDVPPKPSVVSQDIVGQEVQYRPKITGQDLNDQEVPPKIGVIDQEMF